jgi:SAM-dependent methyltransferase
VTVASKRFSPGAIRYDSALAVQYEAGRALPPEALGVWRTAIQPFVPVSRPVTILDAGAGTGRFLPLLASFPGARVLALELSRDMLGVVREPVPGVSRVCGSAEAIPLSEESCDVAWLSQVFHHLPRPNLSARELDRVMRPGGRVLVRGTFGDRLDGFPTLFHFFPSARQICAGLPTIEGTVGIFVAAGFTFTAHRRIRQNVSLNLREFADRTRLRADTSLRLIADEDFEAGLAALDAAMAREVDSAPVIETLDLLVFSAPARRRTRRDRSDRAAVAHPM